MTALTKSNFISTARTYKGYQEKSRLGTRSQLWDFHWSPGYNNYTIWAELFKDYTGNNFQGQAWCAMAGSDWLVLALQQHCAMTEKEAIAEAKTLLGGTLPYNCQDFVSSRKGDSRLSHTPSVGSYVIFWSGTKYGHWGVVTGVTKDGFISVEGNTSDSYDKVVPDGGAVCEKFHSNDSRHYFWNLGLPDETILREEYTISTGVKGLRVTQNLNIRNLPGTSGTSIIGSYKAGTYIYPTIKTFIDSEPWYKTDKGWISAKYLEGWIQEFSGLWWYVHEGYTYTMHDWELIDGHWCYFLDDGYLLTNNWIQWNGTWYYVDANGYMATNAYVKSATEDYYWYLNERGECTNVEVLAVPKNGWIVK